MRNYVGVDVSLKSTSICILDEKGSRLQEGEVDPTPEAIHRFLMETKLEIEQIGLEIGNTQMNSKVGVLARKRHKFLCLERATIAE
jgi:hypothetical protein